MSNLLPLQAVLNARASVTGGDTAAGRRGCPLSDLRDRLRRCHAGLAFELRSRRRVVDDQLFGLLLIGHEHSVRA